MKYKTVNIIQQDINYIMYKIFSQYKCYTTFGGNIIEQIYKLKLPSEE